jgi:hypothetical protein
MSYGDNQMMTADCRQQAALTFLQSEPSTPSLFKRLCQKLGKVLINRHSSAKQGMEKMSCSETQQLFEMQLSHSRRRLLKV